MPFATRRTGLHCAPFVGPELSPDDAPVVWLPDVEQAAIPVRVHANEIFGTRDFSLPLAPVRVHVHFDGYGRQIVTMENDVCRIVLIVDGAPVTLGPVRLQIGWVRLSCLAETVYQLNGLAHLLVAQRYFGPLRRPGPTDARHLRNAIIAYDGERAGASRRQIASFIYGEGAIKDEWSDPSGRLKAMVKRDVLRGRRLVSVGWRDLIVAGTLRRLA